MSARARALGGWAALLGIALVALVAGIVPAIGGSADTARAAEASPAVTEAGRGLYTATCASCHGLRGEGAPGGPPLAGVGAASADFYLRTGRMPLGSPGQRPIHQEPVFSEEEIVALVAFVASLGDGPEIPQVSRGGDLREGWRLYQANCAACHAATGAGNAVGGGFFAYGLGEATPVEIAEAMIVGPGAMPLFEFPQQDRDAIVAYVEYLRTAPTPGGAPIGGIGPVAEGFVAVAVALVALVLVARFVGRRSHEGEPDVPLSVGPEPGLPPEEPA